MKVNEWSMDSREGDHEAIQGLSKRKTWERKRSC